MKSTWTRWWILCALTGISGCSREEKGGEAPPAPAPKKTDPCQDAPEAPVAGLPGSAAGYCVDPRSDVRRYGIGEAAPLDAVCIELFNGECELYKSFGLEGVKTLRYVAKDGAPSEVSVVMSSFRRSAGAFGFFTQRILGTGLPSEITVEPLEVEAGRAVAGLGMTIVWRGKSVVELTYVSSEETPEEIAKRSPSVLRPLSQTIAQTLIGPKHPERDVLLLEALSPDKLGISLSSDGLLGVTGTGPSASAYFSPSEFPHRVFVAERSDEETTEDLFRLLRRAGVEKKLEGRDIVRLRRTREGQAPETWFLTRNDKTLLGVGPLELGEAATQTTPKEREARAKAWESFATKRIEEVSRHEKGFNSQPEITPSGE